MVISSDNAEKIRDLLNDHPEGLSITDIVKIIPINRNTASRYLDTLLVSGQVEMRHFGMAKIYTVSQRLPVSSVLSISSEYIMQLDRNLRIIFLNEPFLHLLELAEHDVVGKKIDYTRIPVLFDEEYSRLLRWISEGLSGVGKRGEIRLLSKARILICRISPAVFADGKKGVSVLFEDVTAQRADEARLKESEEKFRTLVEASADGILVSDSKGLVMVWNPALSRITGIPQNEAVGVPLTDIMTRCLVPERKHKDSIDAIISQMRSAIRTGTSRFFNKPLEMQILHPDGTRRIIQQSHFPIRTSGGILLGSVVHDITERNRMLDEIRGREDRFRTLFNNAADMITVHGFTSDGVPGRYIEVNDVGCRRLGYTREELLRMSPQDLIDPSCKRAMRENAKKLLSEGSAVFEMIHVTREGRRIPVEVRSHIFEYQGERLVIGQVRDLSHEKEAEAAIRESQTRLQMALAGSDTGLWELDIPAMKGSIDDQAAQILGYRKEDIGTHKTDWDALSHPDDVPLITKRLIDYLEGRTSIFESEHRMRHASGEWIWMAGKGKITRRLPDGSPLRISGTLHDVTKRKLAEDAIRASEKKYRNLLGQLFDAEAVVKNGTIASLNERAAIILGAKSPQDLAGRPVSDMMPPDARTGLEHRIQEIDTDPLTQASVRRENVIRSDGTVVTVEAIAIRTIDEGVPAILVMFREITDRVRMEDTLRASEEKYRMLAESASDMIYITDDNGNLLYANTLCARMYGCTQEELVGKTQADLFPADIARNHLEWIRKVVSSGEAIEHEEVIPAPAGSIRIDIKLSPIRSRDGKVNSVVGIARDITSRAR